MVCGHFTENFNSSHPLEMIMRDRFHSVVHVIVYIFCMCLVCVCVPLRAALHFYLKYFDGKTQNFISLYV